MDIVAAVDTGTVAADLVVHVAAVVVVDTGGIVEMLHPFP